MSGSGGRSWTLRSASLGQWNRQCSIVSSRWLHKRAWHIFFAITPIIPFSIAFNGMCCFLSLKMVDRSFLLNLSMSPFGFGVVMYLNKILPVFTNAHLFSNSSLQFNWMICFAAWNVAWICVFFAKVSALSLPGMLECPGIYCKITLMSWRSSDYLFRKWIPCC